MGIWGICSNGLFIVNIILFGLIIFIIGLFKVICIVLELDIFVWLIRGEGVVEINFDIVVIRLVIVLFIKIKFCFDLWLIFLSICLIVLFTGFSVGVIGIFLNLECSCSSF